MQMIDRVWKIVRSGPGGFTLIELMVATAISALVIGIISVCLSFSLRVWQKTVRAKPDHTLLMAQLLQRQLSECDPIPINFQSGSRPLFQGKSDSICFITSQSVKAISKGVPVAVRYTYDPGTRVLSYAELVMNPYRTQALEQFAAGGSPSGTRAEVRTYRVDFPKFSLAYAGKEAREFSGSWLSTEALPVEILLNWKGVDGVAHSMVCMVNSPFAIESNFLNASTPGGLNQ